MAKIIEYHRDAHVDGNGYNVCGWYTLALDLTAKGKPTKHETQIQARR